MHNGVAIFEKTDTGTKGIYIDQDTIECARLNARTNERIKAAEAALLESAIRYRREARAENRRKAYDRKTLKYILIRGCIVLAATWAGFAGMIHPVVSIPVSLFCLCTACVRLGEWFGRGKK